MTKPTKGIAGVTEAEAHAALRATTGFGDVEPWIAQRAREATPRG